MELGESTRHWKYWRHTLCIAWQQGHIDHQVDYAATMPSGNVGPVRMAAVRCRDGVGASGVGSAGISDGGDGLLMLHTVK